eukprot:14055147-Alexandrium_andersonii.AAC.1
MQFRAQQSVPSCCSSSSGMLDHMEAKARAHTCQCCRCRFSLCRARSAGAGGDIWRQPAAAAGGLAGEGCFGAHG